MGNCIHCPLKSRSSSESPKKVVLLLVGLDNAGKTCTAKGLIGEIGDVPVPTVGFSSVSLMYGKYSIFIYDLGGGPQIRGIWDKYFVDVHGIIFVVDASDANRLEECRSILSNLLSHPKLARKPLLLLANKQDREGALDELDIVERLDLERLVNEQRTPTMVETCSATVVKNAKRKLDPGIHSGYKWLVNAVIRDYALLNARVTSDMAEAKAAREKQRQARLESLLKNRSNIETETNDQITVQEEIISDPFRPISEVVKNSEKTKVKNGSILLPSSREKKEGSQINGTLANANEIVPESSNISVGVTDLVKEQLELEKTNQKKTHFFRRKNKTSPSPVILNSLPTSPEKISRAKGDEPGSGGQDSGIGSPPKQLPPLKGSGSMEGGSKLPWVPVPLAPTEGSRGSQERAWDLHKAFEVVPAYGEEKDEDDSVT